MAKCRDDARAAGSRFTSGGLPLWGLPAGASFLVIQTGTIALWPPALGGFGASAWTADDHYLIHLIHSAH
jgi:hypothetical protein